MKKISLLLSLFSLVLLISLPSLAKASELNQDVDYEIGNTPVVDLSEDNTLYEAEVNDQIAPQAAPPLHLAYKITKTELYGRGWGSFRQGPTGKGPATLGINQSTTLNRQFTNTISGDYPIGKGKIGASLGVTIGEAKTYGTSYTITIEDGKKKTIQFRPEYEVYRVTQRLYKNGIATDIYKHALVTVFVDWDYDWYYSN